MSSLKEKTAHLLRTGNYFCLNVGDSVYARVPEKRIYNNGREDETAHGMIVISDSDKLDGYYIVSLAQFDGGGSDGYGSNYPNGWHVYAEKVSDRTTKVDFFQTGSFTALIPAKDRFMLQDLPCCSLCQKDPRPNNNFGEDRRCAFKSGVFTDDNWRCGTIDALDDLIEDSLLDVDHRFYNSDTNLTVIPIQLAYDETEEDTFPGDGFLVLTRYKSRGAVSSLVWLGDFQPRPVTLKLIEQVLSSLKSSPLEDKL